MGKVLYSTTKIKIVQVDPIFSLSTALIYYPHMTSKLSNPARTKFFSLLSSAMRSLPTKAGKKAVPVHPGGSTAKRAHRRNSGALKAKPRGASHQSSV